MPAQNDSPQNRPDRREDVRAGFTILKEGDADGAREIFTALLEEDPNLAPAHLGLGRVFLSEGDPGRGLEHFQTALTIQPDMAQARFLCAEAQEKLGEVDEALQSYDAALELDPLMSVAASRKAALLMRENRGEEAQETLAEAARRNPQDPLLRLALARAMSQAGDVGHSEAEYERAIEMNPDAWFGHFGLGTTLLRGRKYAPARDALTKAARLAPGNAKVHQALGSAHTGLQEHSKAIKAYDDARRIEPDNMRAIIGAAMARSAAGRHHEALEVLRSVGRKGNRIPPVQKALGDIYFAMARYSDASEAYCAMILNSKQMGDAASDLVDLANSGEGTEPEAFARQLQDAIKVQHAARAQQRRADPQARRTQMMSRRQRAN